MFHDAARLTMVIGTPGKAWSAALVAGSLTLAACGAPALRNDSQRSLAFVSPYAHTLSRSCQGSDLAITFARPGSGQTFGQISTDPPTTESHWTLTACGHTIDLTMDCREQCWAHEWPPPANVAKRRFEDPLLEELIAVVESEPACQDDDNACCQRGFHLRVMGKSMDHTSQFELEQCGHKRIVDVRCSATEWARCTALPQAR
jgi:hypothetical protein